MIKAAVIICVLAILGLASPAPAQLTTTNPATDQIDSIQITRSALVRRSDTALRQGIKFLFSRQATDGSWTTGANDPDAAGRTALVVLALLYCGESHQSPPLDRAIKYLKKSDPAKSVHATYAVALRACVYASLPEVMRNQELRADLRWLQQAMITRGASRGMYSYTRELEADGDFSNSQYGVLAVWYAALAGLEVPRNYWKQVEDAWHSGQNEDGGWAYRAHRGPSVSSMTAAGAATLFITQDYLHSDQAQDLTKVVTNKPIENALRWLGDNFSTSRNVGWDLPETQQPDLGVLDLIGSIGQREGSWIQYMLFAFERVGEASGLTRFGTHKWFDEGANHLASTQKVDGSWPGRDGSEVSTAYALLFLSRGRAPVVLQKLQFDGRWNNRPRDAAALTQFMRRATERHVNWQVVSIDAAPDEFRQSPLLYVASDQAPTFTSEQKARIKAFIEQGGMLVCANEGSRDAFTSAVMKLGTEMFPSYTFRDLPKNHLINTINFSIPPTDSIRVLGNGVRELIVLFPTGDMTWKWHSANGAFLPRTTPYASLANLWLYMTDRANPHFKGEDTWIDRNDPGAAPNQVQIARIKYDGNWNPEPAGWQRLANLIHNQNQIDLVIRTVTAPIAGTPLAFLTGTATPKITAADKAAIRAYLDQDGFLIAEAAGGSTEAAGGFEAFIRELYPTALIAPLPLDHPIYHAGAIGGVEINNNVNYRRAAELQNVHLPRLRGVTVNGKLLTILSNEDLSGGLVGYNIAGIAGYTPASATDLMRNIILWRSNRKP